MIDANCPECGSAKYDRHKDDGKRYVHCENCGFNRSVKHD